MNQRQLNRCKKLIDVIVTKIKKREPKSLANRCISINYGGCGTRGCVFGDFAIAMRAVDIKRLQQDVKKIIANDMSIDMHSFAGFSAYLSGPLRDISMHMVLPYKNPGIIQDYFGVKIHPDFVFGVEHYGGWQRRYNYMVNALKKAGHEYDPLKKAI